MPAPFNSGSLSDRAWQLLRRAETHDPHRPIPMIAAQDRPPILMWACPLAKCGNYSYTYNIADKAPLCRGGLEWSFTTTARFDHEEI